MEIKERKNDICCIPPAGPAPWLVYTKTQGNGADKNTQIFCTVSSSPPYAEYYLKSIPELHAKCIFSSNEWLVLRDVNNLRMFTLSNSISSRVIPLPPFTRLDHELLLDSESLVVCPPDNQDEDGGGGGGDILFFFAPNVVECGGNLSVFIGYMGKWVRVYELDQRNMKWIRVTSLPNHVLFIGSTSSSFSVVAKERGMGNRIYLARRLGKGILFYALDTGKYSILTGEEYFEDFSGTKEHGRCCWI